MLPLSPLSTVSTQKERATGWMLTFADMWSKTSILQPHCVFTPGTLGQVANYISFFLEAWVRFTVRTGGHMPNLATDSIADGVLISMGSPRGRELSQIQEIARVGTGHRWRDVDPWISNHGLGIEGG